MAEIKELSEEWKEKYNDTTVLDQQRRHLMEMEKQLQTIENLCRGVEGIGSIGYTEKWDQITEVMDKANKLTTFVEELPQDIHTYLESPFQTNMEYVVDKIRGISLSNYTTENTLQVVVKNGITAVKRNAFAGETIKTASRLSISDLMKLTKAEEKTVMQPNALRELVNLYVKAYREYKKLHPEVGIRKMAGAGFYPVAFDLNMQKSVFAFPHRYQAPIGKPTKSAEELKKLFSDPKFKQYWWDVMTGKILVPKGMTLEDYYEQLHWRDKVVRLNKEKTEVVEGTVQTEVTFKDKYGHEYPYNEKSGYNEWVETNVVDLGNGQKVSTCTIKVHVPMDQNPDGFAEIEVKKYYFANTNMVVYESGNGYFSPNPVSAYVGEKMSFSETDKKAEYKTIDDLQKLNYNHRFDKWYDYGKVSLNVGADILTVSTLGMSAAASTTAKGIAVAFVKAVVPTTTKDVVQFTLVQGGQMAGDYLVYNSNPKDDMYKTVTGLFPVIGTYYAAMDTSSNDPLKGFYKPLE